MLGFRADRFVVTVLMFGAVCLTSVALRAQQGNSSSSAGAASVSAPVGGQSASQPSTTEVPKSGAQKGEGQPKIPNVLSDAAGEDLNSLKEPAEFAKALPGYAEELGAAQLPDFSRELVEGTWREEDPIDLWILKPKGVEKPPVILYLFSYPSTTERYKDEAYAKFLTKNGFAAVGFVSALTGQRYHDIPQKQWFVSELKGSLARTVHDVQAILDYLQKRGDFDMTRVGMFGDGSGATIAILAAATDPRIKAVDLLNPWGDWPDWLAGCSLIPKNERENYLQPAFLKSVENFDPVKWLPTLTVPKVRLQSITKGITVTPELARQRVEAAAPPNVTIVHYDDTQDFLKKVTYQGAGFNWIKEQLGGKMATAEPPATKSASTQ